MSILFSFIRLSFAGIILLPFILRFIFFREIKTTMLPKLLHRLGPSWVKLGQFLATRPDIVGKQLSTQLSILQDNMQPFSNRKAKAILEKSLGKKLEDVFCEFSEPVAAASIAQVHKAKISSQDKYVAVKIIRPNVRKRFASDLKTFYHLAYVINFLFPKLRRLQFIASLDVLAQTTAIEMDLRLEAAALNEMFDNTKQDKGFTVPVVFWDYCKRDCLVMEWIDGIKLTDAKKLEKKLTASDKIKLASTLNQSFLRHTLRDGFFHADMHQGNLFINNNKEIVAVDMGISGRLTFSERKFLGEVLLGFIRRDYLRIAEIHFEYGYVPANQDKDSFAQALRAVGEPIHGQDSQNISMGNTLSLLFEITELFDMQTQPRLLLLQKTMVVVEGVARLLDSNFNMWESAKPVVVPLMSRMLGPVGKIEEMATGIKGLKHMAQLAPEMAQVMQDTIHNGVPLNEKSLSQLHKKGRGFRAAILTIAISILAILGYSLL